MVGFNKGDLKAVFSATGIEFDQEITPVALAQAIKTTENQHTNGKSVNELGQETRERNAFNAGQKGNDVEASTGLIAQGNQTIGNNQSVQEKNKKREQATRNLLIMIQQLEAQRQGLLSDMGDILDKMKGNANKIKNGRQILESRNTDAAMLYLMSEFDYNEEQLSLLSDDEIFEVIKEKISETELTQDGLKEELIDKAKEYEALLKTTEIQDDPALYDRWNKDFQDLKDEAAKYGLDIDEALLDARDEHVSNKFLLDADYKEKGEGYVEKEITKPSIDTDQKNNALFANMRDSIPKENEADQAISFAQPDIKDPMSETDEGSLSNLFGKMAADIPPEPEGAPSNEKTATENIVAITPSTSDFKIG